MTSYVTKEQLDNLAPFLAKYSDAELAVSDLGELVARSRSTGMGCFGEGCEGLGIFPYAHNGAIDSARPLTDEEQEALGLVSEDPEPSVDKFEVNEAGTVITWMGETYVLEGAYPSLDYIHVDAIERAMSGAGVTERERRSMVAMLKAFEALRRIEG